MRDITLGQYIPGDSCIHRLDPRTKIFLMIAYIVMVFLINSIFTFAVPLLFIIAVLLMSKISITYIGKSIKPLRWLILFMFILNLFFTKGEPIWDVFLLRYVTLNGIRQSVFISLRLIFLVSGTSLLTLTTSPIALTDGLERIMMPLKVFRFPAHELAMMMTIALRFIPTLMEEADKIKKAQMARGADFESGNIIRRAKSMIPILIPLFVSAFRRADELAMAMESRCYHGGDGRTRMHQMRFHWADLFAVIIVAVIIAAVVLAQNLIVLPW
ncbi:MAG: energy-coupling factor transporter transmembrane component T [Clostridia bacterium]|nr:energy-coupling factor transporter transmembrane component T [Clostridia bacterium]